MSGKNLSATPVTDAKKGADMRQDASNGSSERPVPCAYGPCKVAFVPARPGQRYHSARCRKRDWFESKHVVARPATAVENLQPLCEVLVPAVVKGITAKFVWVAVGDSLVPVRREEVLVKGKQ